MTKDEQAAIIYFALTNLMQTCIEVLQDNQNLPQDKFLFYQNLLTNTELVLDEVEKELTTKPTPRPKW